MNVATQHGTVGNHHMISNDAIVANVRRDHEQAAVADPRDVAGLERPVDGRVFAKYVAIADFRRARMFRHVDVLRHAADDRAFHQQVVAANDCARFHRDAGGQVTAVAQHDSGFHDTERPDPHVRTKLSVRTDDGKRMN